MKKKLNLNELMWFLILIGFICYFYMNIITNKLTLFVHPKMVKYVKFSLYFFIILAAFQGKKIFTHKKPKRLKLGYIMFIIPLALGFLLKPEGVSAESAINKGFSLTSQLKINSLKHKHTVLADGTEICDIDTLPTENVNNTLKEALKSSPLLKEKTITMTSASFIEAYEDIYGNLHNHVGKAINMKGFVYKQKGINKNEFILSRIVVSCCAADAQLVGILCDYSKGELLTEGTWINISGTLGERDYLDEKNGEISVIPIIKVKNIEISNKQGNEYIYN